MTSVRIAMNDLPALRPEDGTPVVSPLSDYPSHLEVGMDNALKDNAESLRDLHIQRANRLLDRARARREKALTDRDQGIAARVQDLTSRDLCIVQTTTDGRSVTNHIFEQVPRLGTLIARTGPDVFLLSVRVQTTPSED